MEYQAFVIVSYFQRKKDLIVGVEVPVMTLYPCSESIGKYSAYNQRGKVTIKVRFKKFI